MWGTFEPKTKKAIYKKNQFKTQLVQKGPNESKWTKIDQMDYQLVQNGPNEPKWTEIDQMDYLPKCLKCLQF